MSRIALLFACLALFTPGTADVVQAQSVILTFQVIEADGFTESDPAIADVRETLQELFRFRGYRLAADAVIRVSHGSFDQVLASAEGTEYRIGASDVRMEQPAQTGTNSTSLALGDLALWLGENRLIITSLRVPIGQTVVVGGKFTQVQEVGGAKFNRSNIFAFTLGTGKVLRNFAPSTDKAVRALAVGGNGSVFEHADAQGLAWGIGEALRWYADAPTWSRVVANAMDADFSWDRQVPEYVRAYERLVS